MTRRDTLLALLAEAQQRVLAACATADQLRISGYVGNQLAYDGVAARAGDWALIDLLLPSELPTLPAAPTDAQGDPLAEPPEAAAEPDSSHEGAAEADHAVAAVPPDVPLSLPDAPSPAHAAVACPARDAAGFDDPVGDESHYSANALVYSTGDDAIILTQDLGATLYDASDGDDIVYVYSLDAGTEVWAGRGSDTVVLCTIDDVSLIVVLDSGTLVDSTPDTLIIEPGALVGVTEGFTREIRVLGFSQPADRLVLRVPEDLGEVSIPTTAPGLVEITVGDVRVVLMAPHLAPSGFDPSGVTVERVAASLTQPASAQVTAPVAPGAGIE